MVRTLALLQPAMQALLKVCTDRPTHGGLNAAGRQHGRAAIMRNAQQQRGRRVRAAAEPAPRQQAQARRCLRFAGRTCHFLSAVSAQTGLSSGAHAHSETNGGVTAVGVPAAAGAGGAGGSARQLRAASTAGGARTGIDRPGAIRSAHLGCRRQQTHSAARRMPPGMGCCRSCRRRTRGRTAACRHTWCTARLHRQWAQGGGGKLTSASGNRPAGQQQPPQQC